MADLALSETHHSEYYSFLGGWLGGKLGIPIVVGGFSVGQRNYRRFKP
jgi:hypothetical protein